MVTGGAGFIGHHLVRSLRQRGSEVLVVDDLSTGLEERIPEGVRFERLDLASTDPGDLLRSWRPSAVYHLAAQASVARSELDPEADLLVNGLATLRLVRAAAANGVGRFLFVSSGGAVYGETVAPATEETLPKPASAYGAHKLLGEAYVALSGLSYAVARPSNVYGPGQAGGLEGAVVAAFVEAAQSGSALVVHGDGTQERDFIDVADVVDALLLLGAVDDEGIWNVSSGSSTTVGELAQMVEREANLELHRSSGPARPGDVQRSRISNAKLRRLGWAPRIGLVHGLRALVDRSGS